MILPKTLKVIMYVRRGFIMITKEQNEIAVLNKHNNLVKGRYNLTSTQNKIYQFILFNTQKNVKVSRDMAVISIDKKDFKNILPSRECETQRLIANFEKIRAKPLQYKRVDPEGNLIWSGYSFFSSYHYYEKTQKVEFRIELEVVTMLSEYVKNGYTPLNIKNIASLNSYYSQRLYELIKLWSNTKSDVTYTITELKEYFMLDKKKSYKQYGIIKSKVINPAVDELNELGVFKISYTENKVANGKVESITFIIKEKEEHIDYIECDFKEKPQEDEVENKPKDLVQIESYTPDDSVFTTGTIRSFKKDFKHIDFKNKYMEEAFDDAVMITLEKDETENIKAGSYKFFKSILEKKIEMYKLEEIQDLQHKEEMNLNW